MVYQGNRITVSMLEDGIANMHFNAEGESVNKFDMETNKQLGEAVSALEQADDVKGLIVRQRRVYRRRRHYRICRFIPKTRR